MAIREGSLAAPASHRRLTPGAGRGNPRIRKFTRGIYSGFKPVPDPSVFMERGIRRFHCQVAPPRMLRSLFGKIASDLLVEITREELRIYSFSDDAKYVDEPLVAVEVVGEKEIVKAIGSASRNCAGPGIKVVNPFDHDRSMISSFTYAEKVLQFAFESIQTNAFKAAPRVVMHQLEKNEGGLTEIEERLLGELAIAAGAREVVVYQGDRIIPEHDTFENIRARAKATW